MTTDEPTPSETVPAFQEMHQDQKELFDTVDDLRSLGIGKIVDLPQIIVVGNQSSGKSSVLSALSGVQFPTSSAVCTRFPMELALRTGPKTNIDVSIIPEEGEREILTTRSSTEEIPDAIEEGKKALGIDKNTRDMFPNVLNIEITAPNVPNLTLVDLPGLYNNESQWQSKEGIKVAFKLAEKYMSQKRSIILAVVSAAGNVVMDQAIKVAKKKTVDPNLSRVLGIITQLDVIERNQASTQEYLQVAQGRDPTLRPKYGWHVLRNLSEEETRLGLTDKDRDVKETEFFGSGPWENYASENKGIRTLHKKLIKLSRDHISESLPRVVFDIETALAKRTAAIESLGASRNEVSDIRDYLHDIVQKFRETAQQAVRGSYFTQDFFQHLTTNPLGTGNLHVRKLRAFVRELNRAFTTIMLSKGHKFAIQWSNGSSMPSGYLNPLRPDIDPLIRQYYVHLKDPEGISEPAVKQRWASKVVGSKGYEFPGETNPVAMLDLFAEQSSPWQGLAKNHLHLLVYVTEKFAEELLQHILAADPKTYESIRVNYISPFFKKKKRLVEAKLDEILPSTAAYEIALEDRIESETSIRYRQRLISQIETLESALKEESEEVRRFIEAGEHKREAILRNPEYGREYVTHLKNELAQRGDPLGKESSDFALEKTIDNMMVYYEVK